MDLFSDNNYRDCIISYIDLIDIKPLIQDCKEEAVSLMRKMHGLVHCQISQAMPEHAHAYTWNDSVLLMAYYSAQCPTKLKVIMQEVNELKKKIDQIAPSYVVAVKGKAFPELPIASRDNHVDGNNDQPRHTHIKASSMAFANCFEIDKVLGKKFKKPWYLDERIVDGLSIDKKPVTHKVKMLPEYEERNIYMYNGYLW